MDGYLLHIFINVDLLHYILNICPIVHPNAWPYKRQCAYLLRHKCIESLVSLKNLEH